VKPVQHRVCGGIFTPDPDLPARYDADGRLISPAVCRCSLPGWPGDAHHTAPEPTADVRQLAAGEGGER
jgi:hypothetical protein